MLTDDEIFLAIDDVPITQNYVVAVGRAIAAKVLEKLRPAEPLAVIGALERTAQLLEDQAHTLIEAHDYSCIYPEGDAKSLREALDVFTRIGAGPSGVMVDPPDLPGWKPSALPLSDDQLRKAMTNATVARAYAVGADPKTAAHPASLPWCREFARAVLNAAGVDLPNNDQQGTGTDDGR